jgi:hypothetical protein
MIYHGSIEVPRSLLRGIFDPKRWKDSVYIRASNLAFIPGVPQKPAFWGFAARDATRVRVQLNHDCLKGVGSLPAGS